MKSYVTAVFCLSTFCSVVNAQQADTVYTGGKIYTVNEEQPWAEAVAVKDGKFIKVGSNDDVKALAGNNTKVVDLDGKFIRPKCSRPSSRASSSTTQQPSDSRSCNRRKRPADVHSISES